MTVTLVSAPRHYMGLSSDPPPTAPPVGSRLYLTDTQGWQMYDGTDWQDLPSPTVIGLNDSEITASAAELNLNDGALAGVAVASVTLVAGAAKELPDGLVEHVVTKGANYPVVAGDSGKVIVVTAADKVMTLPATIAGLRYIFVLAAGGLSAGTGLQVAPNAADKIMGNGFTSLDNKAAVLAGSGDREGDLLEVVGDGVDGWYITRVIGTWTRAS